MIINEVDKGAPQTRCQYKVWHPGGQLSGPSQKGCRRISRYKIDDEFICIQHAGVIALKYLIEDL